MKFRIVIPDQDLEPLSGETPADAIHRAVIGRVVNEVSVERARNSDTESPPDGRPGSIPSS